MQSKTVKPVECLHYAMSQQVDCVITGCDSIEVLDQALGLARNFQPLNQAAIKELLSRTSTEAASGALEKYKNSPTFDGTSQNPAVAGIIRERVLRMTLERKETGARGTIEGSGRDDGRHSVESIRRTSPTKPAAFSATG